MLRAQAEHVDQISDVIGTLNKLLCRDNTHGRFVTLFYAVLDGERHKGSYVNEGHPPAFLLLWLSGGNPFFHRATVGDVR